MAKTYDGRNLISATQTASGALVIRRLYQVSTEYGWGLFYGVSPDEACEEAEAALGGEAWSVFSCAEYPMEANGG